LQKIFVSAQSMAILGYQKWFRIEHRDGSWLHSEDL